MDYAAHNLLEHFISDCNKMLVNDKRWIDGQYAITSGSRQSSEGNLRFDLMAWEQYSAPDRTNLRSIAIAPMAIDLASGDGSAYTMTMGDPISHSVGRVSMGIDGKVNAKDPQAYKKALELVYAYMMTAISGKAV